MLNILWTELLKLKRTNLLWLVIIGAITPALLNCLVEIEHLDWENFLQNNLIFYTLLTGSVMFALIGGYIVAREFIERTANQLFAYPYHRSLLMMGKFMVILLIILIMFLVNFFVVILSGMMIGEEPLSTEILWKYAGIYVWMFVLQALLIPMIMTAGMVGKSYVPPIVLGVVALLISMMVFSGVEDENSTRILLGSYLPFGAMVVHMSELMGNKNVASGVYLHALYPHTLVFILFFIFNAVYYSKAEIHSGS